MLLFCLQLSNNTSTQTAATKSTTICNFHAIVNVRVVAIYHYDFKCVSYCIFAIRIPIQKRLYVQFAHSTISSAANSNNNNAKTNGNDVDDHNKHIKSSKHKQNRYLYTNKQREIFRRIASVKWQFAVKEYTTA